MRLDRGICLCSPGRLARVGPSLGHNGRWQAWRRVHGGRGVRARPSRPPLPPPPPPPPPPRSRPPAPAKGTRNRERLVKIGVAVAMIGLIIPAGYQAWHARSQKAPLPAPQPSSSSSSTTTTTATATTTKAAAAAAAAARTLHPVVFTPFTLLAKEAVSPSSSIFTLRPEKLRAAPTAMASFRSRLRPNEAAAGWPRAIWSVLVKQPQLQIGRYYTPLPPMPPPPSPSPSPSSPRRADGSEDGDDARDDIRLLIRREEGGELSTYLHRLAVGARVELRGPHVEYVIADEVRTVVFLAGGTGIAPALQAARCILLRAPRVGRPAASGPASTIHILWACRSRQDCLGGQSDVRGRGASDADADEPSRSVAWLRRFLPLWSSTLPTPTPNPTPTPPTKRPPTDPAAVGRAKNPIVQELEALQRLYPGRLTVDYFVDEEHSFLDARHVAASIAPPLSASRPRPAASRVHADGDGDGASKEEEEEEGGRLVLVAGPEGFVAAMAGAKAAASGGSGHGDGHGGGAKGKGEEGSTPEQKDKQVPEKNGQGTLAVVGGILAQVGAEQRGWRVWKL
ncbi:MAG: hypothetical protein M1826_002716 [Phylliscum demangeonii]|nr:MAG: hypothetical protein M1826_002716 [Phylliscum demangeonii]